MVKDFASGEIRPGLATSWSWIDPTTIEFKPRKRVTLQNGERFTADDVVFTVNWAIDPESKIVVYDKGQVHGRRGKGR